ncbi:hypothetical protein DSL72_001412 [Monilinia vaccinii-corymbosi]|uniref:Piwi domain-containing protein n=1 Tax=Monilinia vaccinii-corymbosi TaxID=61207 RepID=A0A8A3P1Y6_9HELO|nr:hypothetical protein DSL72_001412 [Monilinia vaccinii-corymbosi]
MPGSTSAPMLQFNSLGNNPVVTPIKAAWRLNSKFLESRLSKTQPNRLAILWLCNRLPGDNFELLKETLNALDTSGSQSPSIDTDVVTPIQFSFSLQSHDSPLGTARGSHYVVLEDGQRFRENPLKLHGITHNICNVSAPATQALRVCTPARFADILCHRLRCYLRPSLDHRDTYKPANTTNQAAEGFDSDGDYSQMYDNTHKNPWYETMNDFILKF